MGKIRKLVPSRNATECDREQRTHDIGARGNSHKEYNGMICDYR
jgi:hypothetical protein